MANDAREFMADAVLGEARRISDWLRNCADRIDSNALQGTQHALERKVLGSRTNPPRSHLDTAIEILGILRAVEANIHTDALVRRAREADEYDRKHPEEG